MPHGVEGPGLRRPAPLLPGDLTALIGPHAALELCRLGGGHRLPSLTRFLRWARARLIYDSWRQGYDPWILARKHRLSVRTVRRIVAEAHRSETAARTGE